MHHKIYHGIWSQLRNRFYGMEHQHVKFTHKLIKSRKYLFTKIPPRPRRYCLDFDTIHKQGGMRHCKPTVLWHQLSCQWWHPLKKKSGFISLKINTWLCHSTVCSTVFTWWHQRKRQSCAPLAICEGIPSVTSGFPSQRASYAINVPCHDVIMNLTFLTASIFRKIW